MRHFAIDYRTFNLAPPDWLAGATGEWADLPCIPQVARVSGLLCPEGDGILTREQLELASSSRADRLARERERQRGRAP